MRLYKAYDFEANWLRNVMEMNGDSELNRRPQRSGGCCQGIPSTLPGATSVESRGFASKGQLEQGILEDPLHSNPSRVPVLKSLYEAEVIQGGIAVRDFCKQHGVFSYTGEVRYGQCRDGQCQGCAIEHCHYANVMGKIVAARGAQLVLRMAEQIWVHQKLGLLRWHKLDMFDLAPICKCL